MEITYLEIMFWQDYPSKEHLLLVLEYSSVWSVYTYMHSHGIWKYMNTWYKEEKCTQSN